MKTFLCLIFSLIVVAAPAFGAVAEHDIGLGLVYVRIHALPADLPAKPAGRAPACVVDLRYVDADAEAAAAFGAWLKSRASPRTPVFVLANTETSGALRKAIEGHSRASGIVVVGIPGLRFRPDVAVKATTDDERRAYDAFEKGTSLTRLLTDNPNKVRNDEASLSRDRLADASAEDTDGDAARDMIVDATLQRAVHLHRALVALRRL